MGKALTIRIHVSGARATLNAFQRLAKEASDSLRENNLKLSRSLAEDVAGAARTRGRQAALMAPTVKAVRDRVPAITAGGAKRVGRHRTPAARLIYASEFGMNRRSGWFGDAKYNASTGRQYSRHVGQGSYWFFKTVHARQAVIGLAWKHMADDIVKAWARG